MLFVLHKNSARWTCLCFAVEEIEALASESLSCLLGGVRHRFNAEPGGEAHVGLLTSLKRLLLDRLSEPSLVLKSRPGQAASAGQGSGLLAWLLGET